MPLDVFAVKTTSFSNTMSLDVSFRTEPQTPGTLPNVIYNDVVVAEHDGLRSVMLEYNDVS